eukprot:1905608-Prymnesium_polylepis.1
MPPTSLRRGRSVCFRQYVSDRTRARFGFGSRDDRRGRRLDASDTSDPPRETLRTPGRRRSMSSE